MKPKSSHPLFDTLIAENVAIRNDADISRALEFEAPLLSKMRNGKLPVSDRMRVAVMRKFGWSLRRLDDIAPPGSKNCGAPETVEDQ